MPVREGVKTKLMSDVDFRMMAMSYKIRDLRLPRMKILKEIGIKTGDVVLDYGCGPGSYITSLSRLVGSSGEIYALDIHPLAIKAVQKIVAAKRLTNVHAILSDCNTGLQRGSVDVVLLYDIIHALDDSGRVLTELRRILRPGGILSVTDHHLKEEEILSLVTRKGLFKLLKKGPMTYSFSKTAGKHTEIS